MHDDDDHGDDHDHGDNDNHDVMRARKFQIRVTPWRDGEAPFISGGSLKVSQMR